MFSFDADAVPDEGNELVNNGFAINTEHLSESLATHNHIFEMYNQINSSRI